jgi:hypothetical protein
LQAPTEDEREHAEIVSYEPTSKGADDLGSRCGADLVESGTRWKDPGRPNGLGVGTTHPYGTVVGQEALIMTSPLKIVGVVLVTAFLVLAAVHVYWAFGGRWGASVAVPRVDDKPAFRPGRTATLVVAGLLVAAAVIIAVRSRITPGEGASLQLARLGAWTLGAVFTLRAVGNFHTFGFFKAVRDSAFARYDTLLFSPLCMAIGLACLLVAWGP